MGKRVLSMVLTLCMVLMLVPVTAAAAGDTGWCDNCQKETSGIWHDVYDTANMQYNEKQHTYQLFQCSVCRGATYTWVDHEWDDTPWPYIGKCRICNAPRSEVLDHEHVQSASIVTIKEPTCTEHGVKIMVCGTPGCYYAVGTYTAFKLGHKYKSIEPSRAATCTEPFYVGAAVCERCGDKREGYYDGEPLGHDLERAEWHTLNGKTCAEATEIGLICINCDAVIEKKTVTPAKCAKENLYVVHPGYPATCLNRGFTRATVCDLCGKQYGGKWIDPLGHDFEGAEWTFMPNQKPTCQHGGWRARYCLREGCNKYEYASQVPKLDHDYSMLYSEEVPATCTEAGTTAKYKCTMCTLEQGGTIGGETIEPLGHSTEGAEWEIVRRATCQETGEKVLRCTRENCGEIVERQEIPKACHPDDRELLAEEVRETCTTYGSTAKYRCKLCGKVTGGESISPIGHNFTIDFHDKAVFKEPTCTEEGLMVALYCLNGCGEYGTAWPINALGHNMVEIEAKAAACTEIGWDAHSACDREGCTYTEGYKEYPLTGHNMVQIEAKAATCTESGWDAYSACDREGCTYAEDHKEYSALGHDTVLHEAKLPTCTEVGWDAYESCSRCDYSTYSEIPALGHEIERVIGQKPTCTEGGWDPYEACMREGCDYNERVEKPALDHKLLHYDGQAPTCTSTGWKDFDVCTRCTYSTFEELEALGHAMEKNYDAKAPTCTEGGWGAYVGCANEGCTYASLREEFSALGHDIEQHNAKAPTCEDNGWNAYEACTRCDYSTYQEIPALNHEAEYHEAQAPTCTEIGWDAYYTCKHDDCDYSSYRELPALGHDIVQHEAQAPTCAEIGWYAYETCTRCDYSTYQEIPPLGNHQLENHEAQAPTGGQTGNIAYWECPDCGKIFADENGETEIKAEDTVLAKLLPKIIEGMGQKVTEGEMKAVSFRSDAAFADFIRVELDGKTLDGKYYTLSEGSTVVTLMDDYVASLSVGEHTLGIVSTNGTAVTTFTVSAKAAADNNNDTKAPQSGDHSHMALWFVLLLASGGTLIGTTAISKKKKPSAR